MNTATILYISKTVAKAVIDANRIGRNFPLDFPELITRWKWINPLEKHLERNWSRIIFLPPSSLPPSLPPSLETLDDAASSPLLKVELCGGKTGVIEVRLQRKMAATASDCRAEAHQEQGEVCQYSVYLPYCYRSANTDASARRMRRLALRCQYLYSRTSKASKLSTWRTRHAGRA